MEFYSFPTLKENMLKHYFWGVNGAEKHTGADGFVLFQRKLMITKTNMREQNETEHQNKNLGAKLTKGK